MRADFSFMKNPTVFLYSLIDRFLKICNITSNNSCNIMTPPVPVPCERNDQPIQSKVTILVMANHPVPKAPWQC